MCNQKRVSQVCLQILFIAAYSATITALNDTQLSDVPFQPTLEIMKGSEVVWQAPPAPKGVIFLAHGCSHSARDFWPKALTCDGCNGLPVEVNITRVALRRGYAVVAISSSSHHQCWDLAGMLVVERQEKGDLNKVRGVLNTLITRQQWTSLPLYALGASSGGAFVLALATEMKLSGVCSQIMGIPPHFLEAFLKSCRARGWPFPPTMFVHMPRDMHTAGMVVQGMKALQAAGVPVREVPILQRPLDPLFFHANGNDEIPQDQSIAIFEALKKYELLDSTGHLKMDPRRSLWRQALTSENIVGLASLRLQPDNSPVSELLNLAFAGHEIISDTTSLMLDWFEELQGRGLKPLGLRA